MSNHAPNSNLPLSTHTHSHCRHTRHRQDSIQKAGLAGTLTSQRLYCLFCRSNSGAAAGLAERNPRWHQEGSVPGQPAAPAQEPPQAGPQSAAHLPQTHHLPEGEQEKHTHTAAAVSHGSADVKLTAWALLQEDDEFRDKLTPISLALNYSLAPPSSEQDLPPVLNHYSSSQILDHVSVSHLWCLLLRGR